MPLHLHGIIIPGHGVASGASAESPYPQGSIAMQAPFFKALGLDLSDCHLGTLNVSIAPARFEIARADFRFENVAWTHLHPPETFSFVRCEVGQAGVAVQGWLYYPHPETKAAHWQSPSMMEIIAPRLEAVGYGDEVDLRFADGALVIGDRSVEMAPQRD
jgi:hypothetical protein